MKTNRFFPLYMLVVMSMLAWQGCTKTEVHQGTIDFGMNTLIESTLKSAEINRYDVVGALVSIVGEDGVLVYDKEMLHFYTFGESFVTEKLKLDEGHYMLSEFLLIDSSRHILWATPLEGSRLAHMVDDPLPIEFSIEANTTTHLQPEVVWVGNQNPGDFGYVTFDVQFVDNFCIGVFYESECYPWDNDSIYTATGDFAPVYPGKFLVLAGDKVIMETYIVAGYNKMEIPRGFMKYRIVVVDCFETKCFSETFHIEELRQFSCREGDLLFIHCGGQPGDVIITPEDVMEPSIKQGVFGRILMPHDDSTSNEDYNVLPLIRDVHLYMIDDSSSIYDLLEVNGCNVFPYFDSLPDVIVRSNSSGYFQARLEVGTYMYMVETADGYYIDLYISSHLPGKVRIYPEEVTNLDIMIQPCYDW